VTNIRFKVEDREVIRVLRSLSPKLNEQIRRKAIRAAARPYINELKAAWRAAPFNGDGSTRKAISATTRLNGPKRRGSGPGAPLWFEIGVDYAGKRGKERQKVWHLMEHGFQHNASGSRVPGRFISTRWVRKRGPAIARRIQAEILKFAKEVTG